MINRKTIAPLLLSAMIAQPALAGPSSQHLGASSTHLAEASAHAGLASVKGVAVIAASPLVFLGASAQASGDAGAALQAYATEPLILGHEVVPAEKALKTLPTPAEQMQKSPANNKK